MPHVVVSSLPPKREHQKYCQECGAVIAKNAEICPACGVRQVGTAKASSGVSKVLIGCLIAVVAVPLLGILAAIAIPKFAGTKEKAYIAAMKSDLRNLATAEAALFADSVKYTSNLARLNYRPSVGVSAPAFDVGVDYWSATVTHTSLPGKICGIAVNTTNTINPIAADGEPACR